MLPLVMEQMPASPTDAVTLSREYVDQADFYLGIFAFRYGFVPEGQEKSVTELEYDRAVERGIPTFIFIAHDQHPLVAADMEMGVGAPKLHAFKERLSKSHVVRTFRSPEELRTEVIAALAAHRQNDADRLHYVSEIPQPPEPWVAHPYTLLGNRPLVGRRDELNVLTDWVAKPSSELYPARLLALVAIGGMGKSALAWHWWNEIAPQVKPLAGRMWWSFYESDARIDNFSARSLAYLTGRPRAETEKIPVRDREDQLLAILDREPHLLVLDGLERELVAYARLDAAHLSDEDLDAKTAHAVAEHDGLPDTTAWSFVGEATLRQTTDPRTGHFLRRLTQVRATRILVTTRLFPYELQDFNGEPLAGTAAHFLRGLSDDDGVALWRSAGIRGSRDAFVPLLRSVDGHPLLVRALAGEIARDRQSPGDFEKWKARHTDFDPFSLPLVQRKSHVLAHALAGLTPEELALLRTVAGFRMPAAYETLAALLVREDYGGRPFSSEEAFDRALADLDTRGLVGWDRRGNRYDLHPIVRGMVWLGTAEGGRQEIAERMRAHFASMPVVKWDDVERFEDLTPAIELYTALVSLGRYDEAFEVFRRRLDRATVYRLGAGQLRVELLEKLFPDGIEQQPRLGLPRHQSSAVNAIAIGYVLSGYPGRAVPCFQRSAGIDEEEGDRDNLAAHLCNLSEALRESGALHAAEASAFRALAVVRSELKKASELRITEDEQFLQRPSLRFIGVARSVRGFADGDLILRRTLDPSRNPTRQQSEGVVRGFLAQSALWRCDAAEARELAGRAWELAGVARHERDFIRAARLQGEAALGLGDLDRADERLHLALNRARAINYVEEELATLTAVAALYDRRGNGDRAREHLDAVWDAAQRGPYPLLHADARNVLAEIEIHDDNRDAAIAAATAAYRLAWCDGPPFAYDYGLRTARAHLQTLGVPEPEMPPYDASQHERIEEIPIEPEDEQPA